MKKVICLLISFGLIFTAMLNFVYAINGNEDNIETVQQTDDTIPNIFYNTHVQDYGWLGTVTNGNVSGMSEESKRLEAIQISLSENSYAGKIEYSTSGIKDGCFVLFRPDDNRTRYPDNSVHYLCITYGMSRKGRRTDSRRGQ